MKPFRLWMLAAILFCGFSCTSCIDDLEDNPVTPEPVVSAHFINEAWMDKTINPGDNFYMYALGSWYTSHAANDQGFWDNNERKNTSTIVNSLFTSDNPLAQHLVRNLKAPRPTLAEDVKDILDYLDIQKPTGIGMLLTEIGKLQDKGLNPIFTKKAYTHPQSHSYAEILTIGTQTRVIELLIVQQRAEEFKRYIKEVLTAIDEATESERMKAEGYEAELEERTCAVFDEEMLIYNTTQAGPSGDDSSDSDQPALKGVRSIPDYIEAGSIARGLNTRAGDGVRDEISFETLAEAFHLLDNCIVDHSSSFKTYVEQGAGVMTALKTMDHCYDYLRYHAVMSVDGFIKNSYNNASDELITGEIVKLLGQTSPLLMNKLNYDVLKQMGQGGENRCRTMLEEMRTVFRQRIQSLDWLSDATRQEALKKLETMQFYVGLPDKFCEGEFTLDDDYTLVQDALAIIGQNEAIRHKLCGMKVEQQPRASIDYEICYGDMNAFYNPAINALVILPQFLSEEMFPSHDEYTQYAVATIFGHEITHGFDATGANYDERGYVRDWWQREDHAKFEAKLQEMIALFNRLEAYPGQPADGVKTLMENMADYGGMILSYTLFKQKKTAEGLQGAALDYACQKFFLHYAKLWQRYYDLNALKRTYEIDNHSVNINRINGIVPLFDDWYRLFNVTGGQLYLAPEKRVRIW